MYLVVYKESPGLAKGHWLSRAPCSVLARYPLILIIHSDTQILHVILLISSLIQVTPTRHRTGCIGPTAKSLPWLP